MKLSLDVIAAYMPEKYQLRRYGPQDRNLRYGRPFPEEAGIEMVPGKIYVANSSFLDLVPAGAAVICVGGRISGSLKNSGTPILHVENSEDAIAVLMDVYEIYDRFEDWDEKLRDILEDANKVRIEDFLICGVEVLQNHIGISDYGLNTLYLCSNEDGVPCIQRRGERNYQYPNNNLEGVRDVCQIEREIKTPYLSAIGGLEHEVYCQNVFSYGRFLGCMFIGADHHSFRECDYLLMDHFFRYFSKLALSYFKVTATADSAETEVIREILSGRMPRGTKLRQIRLEKGQKWRCFVLKVRRGGHYLPQNYMCEQMRLLIPGKVHAFTNGETIVGLLQICEEEGEKQILEDYIESMGYICGLSNPFREITLFIHFYEQASFALECAAEQDEPETVSQFGDKVLRYMLSACTGTMPAGVLYPPGLLRLIENDMKKGSDYVRTLRVYLKNECNASHTAEQLYVHRNSFLKRMERLQRILDMDLGDEDTRLLLRICLRLLEK